MQTRVMASLVLMISATSVAYADEPPLQQILDRVAEKYKTMQTYQCEGTVVGEGKNGDKDIPLESSFSMKLKKPNLYLTTWTVSGYGQDSASSGAVWNTGAQPFLCIGQTLPMPQICWKMPDDATALGNAELQSEGASGTIPALFFSATLPNLTSRLKLYARKLESSAKLAGEDCYVVSGRNLGTVQVTLWISKQDYLIRQSLTSMGSAAAVAAEAQQMTDQQLDEALKEMGLPSTPEDRAKARENTKKLAEAMGKMKMSLSRFNAHYTGISSPELKPADFEFKIPEGALACSWPRLSPLLPSDRWLRRQFELHRADYIQFAALLRKDPSVHFVNSEGRVDIDGVHKRWVREYEELTRTIGAKFVQVSEDGSIDFALGGWGWVIASDSYVGVRYSPNNIMNIAGWKQTVVTSLASDQLPQEKGAVATGLYVVPIEPEWYIYRFEYQE